MAPPDPFGLVGQVLDGQFRVDRFIGEGGFGVVYAGQHLGLQEPIAIKCMKLPPQLSPALVESFVQRFRDESRLHYKLSQGNLHIARTIAAGTTSAPTTRELVPYMVLEWLDGHSMAAEFEGHAKRPLREVIELFETAADALSYAQAQGVIHRDLNPGNFFLTETIAGKRLKVLDFGVAKVLDESRLAVGPRAQTLGQIRIFAPAYGAPEQFDDRLGPVGPYTDVYSLALVLLEAMAGRTVMSGEHLGDYAQGALDPVTRPSPRGVGLSLSAEVEAVFARALALRPQDRWPKVQDFWTALRYAARLPSRPSSPGEDDGKATKMLASMDLSGGPPSSGAEGPSSDRTEVDTLVDDFAEKPTLVGVLPDDRMRFAEGASASGQTGRAGHAGHAGPPAPEAFAPGPATARLGQVSVAYVTPPSPIGGVPVAGQASLPTVPAAPPPAETRPPDRSQKSTVSMSSRPFQTGPQRSSAVPPEPSAAPAAPAPARAAPPAMLAATMAMSRAPTVPLAAPLERTSHVPPERPSHVPTPSAQAMVVQAHAHPHAIASAGPHPHANVQRAHDSVGGQRLSYPEPVHERLSEPPMWNASALPPKPFVPATPPPGASDEPVEVPKSRTGLVVGIVAGGLVVGGVITAIVLGLRGRSTAPPAPDAESIFSVPDAGGPTASATVAPSSLVTAPPEPSGAPSSVAPPPSASAAPSTPAPVAPTTPPGPGLRKPVVPVAPVDPNAFNPALARTKLDHANGVLVICKKPGGPSGRGNASVVFAPSGQVTSVSLEAPFSGTPVGACVTGQLLRVKTSPFQGPAQPMSYAFTVPK